MVVGPYLSLFYEEKWMEGPSFSASVGGEVYETILLVPIGSREREAMPLSELKKTT